jgi:hypothetical protein
MLHKKMGLCYDKSSLFPKTLDLVRPFEEFCNTICLVFSILLSNKVNDVAPFKKYKRLWLGVANVAVKVAKSSDELKKGNWLYHIQS